MMKRLLFLLGLSMFVLVGCFQADKNNEKKIQNSLQDKVAILYFSKPELNGTDTVAGASRVISENEEVLGNVQQMATWISEDTSYPLARIETVENYLDDHGILVDQATTERSTNFRPELKALNINVADYDTLYIGYPIWWSDLPMAMYSFFETNDLSGKKLILFSSHGGSGLANTVETIENLNKGATIDDKNVLSTSRNDVPDAQTEVKNWIAENKK